MNIVISLTVKEFEKFLKKQTALKIKHPIVEKNVQLIYLYIESDKSVVGKGLIKEINTTGGSVITIDAFETLDTPIKLDSVPCPVYYIAGELTQDGNISSDGDNSDEGCHKLFHFLKRIYDR